MTTLTLQPAAAAGIDTAILSNVPNYNYGIYALTFAGNATGNYGRGLLMFDISALPVGATIASATLTLYCETEASADDEVVGVHRALTQWYEGAKNGNTPAAGEDTSTWQFRNHNGSVAWAGGAGGASGSDWTAVATDTTTITGTGAAFDWDVLADVQAWYAGTATNYGWWIINADEANADTRKRFTTSDGTTAGNRPKLVIVYTVGAAGNVSVYARRATVALPGGVSIRPVRGLNL